MATSRDRRRSVNPDDAEVAALMAALPPAVRVGGDTSVTIRTTTTRKKGNGGERNSPVGHPHDRAQREVPPKNASRGTRHTAPNGHGTVRAPSPPPIPSEMTPTSSMEGEQELWAHMLDRMFQEFMRSEDVRITPALVSNIIRFKGDLLCTVEGRREFGNRLFSDPACAGKNRLPVTYLEAGREGLLQYTQEEMWLESYTSFDELSGAEMRQNRYWSEILRACAWASRLSNCQREIERVRAVFRRLQRRVESSRMPDHVCERVQPRLAEMEEEIALAEARILHTLS